jgi:phosphatidylserine decarboxylase
MMSFAEDGGLMRFQTLYEGRHFFVPLGLGAVFFWWLAGDWVQWAWVAAPCTAGFLFCANFFRDPDRRVPREEEVIVAAADGTVDAIEEVEEPEFLKKRCRRVSIFLNVFDVHVNRAPIAGRVVFQQHHPGSYLDARSPYCHQKNEALTWAFEGSRATLVVRQITGAIARRIVPWSKKGEMVEKGHRFGMIRFGSRTDIYLPLDAEVLVAIGDHVEGGSTPFARFAAPVAPAQDQANLES